MLQLTRKGNTRVHCICGNQEGNEWASTSRVTSTGVVRERLNENGLKQSRCTPGLWTHIDKPIQCTLVVDNFGINYVHKETAQFLVHALKKHYTISLDGLQKKRGTTMPGYVEKALKQFNHRKQRKNKTNRMSTRPPIMGQNNSLPNKKMSPPSAKKNNSM
ncbi:hypothetical protein ACHAW6_007266 [Cyclotella cf. meneghiniana]